MKHELAALRLFERALELPEEQVASFLDDACAGNEALRGAVDTLLAKHKQSAKSVPTDSVDADSNTTFISSRSRAVNAGPGQLSEGACLTGRYLIEQSIGAGAMGDVYRARDLKLGRAVAIKVINQSYLQDSSMQQRFLREMQAIAALSPDMPDMSIPYLSD